MRKSLILTIFLSIITLSLSAEPTWTAYASNIMHSGQHRTIESITVASSTPYTFTNQIYYVADGAPYHVFASVPRVILSLMGYKQEAPPGINTFVGFMVKVENITVNDFDVEYYIHGASMVYLTYMYLAVTSNDFNVGYYLLNLDQADTSRKYSINVANNVGQNYMSFSTNKIVMKGFLAGYKMKQGTAAAFSLNFTLKPLNSSHFTITVETFQQSTIESICYFRIGYDQTALVKANPTNVFRDSIYYELVNGVSTKDLSNVGFVLSSNPLIPYPGLQYRNYLMGTNKINFSGAGPKAIEFYLYYAFFGKKATTYTAQNQVREALSTAQYLYSDIFHHAIQTCASSSFYNPTLYTCETTCPNRYFADATLKTCLTCHYSCLTCSAAYLATSCSTCDAALRILTPSNNTCNCLPPKVDNGKDLICLSQPAETCVKFNSLNQCIVCGDEQLVAYDGSCITRIDFCGYYDLGSKKCTKCIETHQFDNGKCVLIPNNSGTNPNASSDNRKKQEVFKCKDDEYIDSLGKCVRRNDPNCKTYNTAGVCTQCKDKYVIDLETNKCTEKKEKNFTKCADDENGFKWVIVEDKCIKIDSNCAVDGYQSTGCFKCKDRFYLQETICYKIPDQQTTTTTSGDVQLEQTNTNRGQVRIINGEEYSFDEAFGVWVKRT